MEIFHLAIPTNNLAASVDFYSQVFKAKLGRRYEDYAVFNFFCHQLVLHHDDKHNIVQPTMYPRHFGIILEKETEFEDLYSNCLEHECEFFAEKFERFINKPGWHKSFFVVDPAKNLIEIKFYFNQADIFGDGTA